MSELDPIILNEIKSAQKELAALLAKELPTQYPWKVFSASEVWTVPEDGDYYIIAAGGGQGGQVVSAQGATPGANGGWGAGGGGQGRGSGGMSAGCSIRQAFKLKKGETLTVTIGARGAANLGNGGDTRVVSSLTSLNMNASGGGRPVMVDGGDIHIPPCNGGTSESSTNASAPGGGAGVGGAGRPGRAGVEVHTSFSSGNYYSIVRGRGGDGGYGGGAPGGGLFYFAGYSSPGGVNVDPGIAGQTWLDFIPGYEGSGSGTDQGLGGQGFVALRRVC